MQKIIVLRLGERIIRDYRVNTHLGLVARALGCKELIYQGSEDKNLRESIEKVNENWGQGLKVKFSESIYGEAKKLKENGFCLIHLTMYGKSIKEKIREIRKKQKICLIVGGEKVLREYYELADYNISIANQPHSEIAALGIALHEIFEGKELETKFTKAKLRIEPQERGKKVVSK